MHDHSMLDEMKKRAVAYQEHGNLLVAWGDDFKFQNAQLQFRNMDQIVAHINANPDLKVSRPLPTLLINRRFNMLVLLYLRFCVFQFRNIDQIVSHINGNPDLKVCKGPTLLNRRLFYCICVFVYCNFWNSVSNGCAHQYQCLLKVSMSALVFLSVYAVVLQWFSDS
jgi:hypothetical protein